MCKLVIDTGALTRNLEKLRHYTSARIIAVVKGGGYGLGLSIARSIVSAHKGKIRAENSGGNNLTITASLPE